VIQFWRAATFSSTKLTLLVSRIFSQEVILLWHENFVKSKDKNFRLVFVRITYLVIFYQSWIFWEFQKESHSAKKSRRLKRVILRMNKLQIFFSSKDHLETILPKNEKVWYSTEKEDFLQKLFRKYLNFSQISH